ncbi:unnamed protein product [Ambrosiozyma monospora]|uniref:Unnamed protein product n=1 Tax=Ambrosiozyma monospora TaxID=43982 RepID=A0A9W7DG59_AMBMO|nr:unnamed protein product [Ambrosiozyma monospora]
MNGYTLLEHHCKIHQHKFPGSLEYLQFYLLGNLQKQLSTAQTKPCILCKEGIDRLRQAAKFPGAFHYYHLFQTGHLHHRLGLKSTSKCQFCHSDHIETTTHLLDECVITDLIWKIIRRGDATRLNSNHPPTQVQDKYLTGRIMPPHHMIKVDIYLQILPRFAMHIHNKQSRKSLKVDIPTYPTIEQLEKLIKKLIHRWYSMDQAYLQLSDTFDEISSDSNITEVDTFDVDFIAQTTTVSSLFPTDCFFFISNCFFFISNCFNYLSSNIPSPILLTLFICQPMRLHPFAIKPTVMILVAATYLALVEGGFLSSGFVSREEFEGALCTQVNKVTSLADLDNDTRGNVSGRL